MSAGEAGINAEMVRRSKRAVVVATSPKLGHRPFARICGSDAIDVLGTDRDASDAHDSRTAGRHTRPSLLALIPSASVAR